jgi:hypothetical protein
MREMILKLMPPWFVEDAKELCYATLAGDTADGATVAERAATAVTRFARIGVTAAQLVQKIGAPQARWSPSDLAQLAVIFKSIERGETTADAEFGAAPGTISADDLAPKNASPAAEAADATRSAAAGTPSGSPVHPTAAAGEAPKSPAQVIGEHLERLGADASREARLRTTGRIAGRVIGSTDDLTPAQVAHVIRSLADCQTPEALDGLLAEIEMASDPTRDGEPGA